MRRHTRGDVWGSQFGEKPHLFLVARGLPRSEQFAATLNAHDIRILRYDVDAGSRILLHGLDDLLA
jgi:hypothetical protein